MRCLKKHTQKSPHFISFPLWIIRATSCTLRGNRWIAYRGWIFRASRCTLRGNRWIAYRGWIIRATSCTLHSKWITLLTVDNTLFEKTHAKITALYFVPCVVHSCYEGIVNRAPRLNLSCIKMHATRESWITYRGWFIRATSCTLRGNWWIAYRGWIFRATRESRITYRNSLFVQQVARYAV